MSAPSVVVIGGGVSGLSAAHRLLELAPNAHLTVLEASDRAGGWIGAVERDGFVIERGADSILAESPGFLSLIERLKITDRVVRTRGDRKGAYVLHGGRLTRIPDGWSLLAPTSVQALSFANVLSPLGRLRVLGDLVLGRGAERESLATFARRRLGWEALERLGQPLASGIYGSDAETLGLEATLPRFATMEKEHRSVVLGLGAEMARKAASGSGPASGTSGARYGLFLAFDRGMQVLVDALSQRLGARVCLNEGAQALKKTVAGWEVRTAARTLHADHVVVAIPGPRASTLLATLDAGLGSAMAMVPHASASTVTFAFDRAAIEHPLDAYGLVVPAVERRRILAMTWASEKWPGRAPADKALIRVFVAGPGEGTSKGVSPTELDERSDEALTRTALRELRALLGVRGEPLFSVVSRFPRAMPRYLVEHGETKRRVEGLLRRHAGLHVAGNALTGVGIPHAVASGERAAEAIVKAASSAPLRGVA